MYCPYQDAFRECVGDVAQNTEDLGCCSVATRRNGIDRTYVHVYAHDGGFANAICEIEPGFREVI